ncbi:MAG: DUF1080 domain-containing protein [Thermomicrobiales bacterium]|nr:DUF1080 domain-containing protein [Thermomicrobiales bacterium]
MVGGMLVSNGSADAVVYAPFNPGDLADYAVEVEIQFIDPRPNSRDDVGFGIIARNNGVGGIDAYYWNNRTSNVAGSRVEAGLRIRSGDDKIAGQEFLLDGEWHKYRLELEGNQIRLYVDGGLVLFAQDNRYLDPGVAGLWVSEGAQINVRSFRIVTLGGEITGPNAEVASDITSSQSDQGISSTGSVDVFSLLPDVDVVGDGLFLIDARYRSLDELVQNYPSPSDTKARFQSWGWRANAICNFAPVPAGAWVEGLLNGVYVSIHQFDGPDHAALALDWSLDGQAVGTPLYEISVPSYGDYARGLYGTLDYGDEVTLLVQKGDYLIRVSAASVGANPTAKAEKILESILVKI